MYRIERNDFYVQNLREEQLSCSLYERIQGGNKDVVIVYLHGNAGTRLDAVPAVRGIGLELGVDLCSFDFSGCGKSEGDFVSLGLKEQEDLEKVLEYLTEKKQYKKVILYGRSMGGVTALLFCSNRRTFAQKHVLALIVDSAFSSLKKLATDIADEKMSFIGGFIAGMSFDYARQLLKKMISGYDIFSLEIEPHAKHCVVPALFCYSFEDKLIKHTHSQRLMEAYGGQTNSFTFQGDHNVFRDAQYFTSVKNFIQNILFQNKISMIILASTNELNQAIKQNHSVPSLRDQFNTFQKNQSGIHSKASQMTKILTNSSNQLKNVDQIQHLRPSLSQRKLKHSNVFTPNNENQENIKRRLSTNCIQNVSTPSNINQKHPLIQREAKQVIQIQTCISSMKQLTELTLNGQQTTVNQVSQPSSKSQSIPQANFKKNSSQNGFFQNETKKAIISYQKEHNTSIFKQNEKNGVPIQSTIQQSNVFGFIQNENKQLSFVPNENTFEGEIQKSNRYQFTDYSMKNPSLNPKPIQNVERKTGEQRVFETSPSTRKSINRLNTFEMSNGISLSSVSCQTKRGIVPINSIAKSSEYPPASNGTQETKRYSLNPQYFKANSAAVVSGQPHHLPTSPMNHSLLSPHQPCQPHLDSSIRMNTYEDRILKQVENTVYKSPLNQKQQSLIAMNNLHHNKTQIPLNFQEQNENKKDNQFKYFEINAKDLISCKNTNMQIQNGNLFQDKQFPQQNDPKNQIHLLHPKPQTPTVLKNKILNEASRSNHLQQQTPAASHFYLGQNNIQKSTGTFHKNNFF